jgi:hypothetical protein
MKKVQQLADKSFSRLACHRKIFKVSTMLIPIPNHDRRKHMKSEKKAKQAEHY